MHPLILTAYIALGAAQWVGLAYLAHLAGAF